MHWDVFAISAAHLYLPKLPWRAHSPNPRETSERMNFNDIDKKTFNLKTLYIDIWCLFFIKKNVTKCLGHHYTIWTSDSNILLALKSSRICWHFCFCFDILGNWFKVKKKIRIWNQFSKVLRASLGPLTSLIPYKGCDEFLRKIPFRKMCSIVE